MPVVANPFIEKARRVNPFIEKARQADREIEERERKQWDVPDSPEGMLDLLGKLDDEQILDMARAHQELSKRLAEKGPQTDDELYDWIKSELDIEIPRVAVCDGHQAPFEFLADLYFERVDAALAMGNRSGGKTLIVAILHWINSLFKSGCESFTFGATEAQSLRCYAHLRGWIYGKNGERNPNVVSSLLRKTVFTNASEVEIAPGCLPSHAQVITPEGNRRIGEIVSKRLQGPVKSFNFQTGQFEWCEITGWHRNGKGDDWLKFVLDISTLQGSTDLYCTEGHRLLRPDGSKAHAVEFRVGDDLCVSARPPSAEQEQVFIGMLLGDASVTREGRYRVCHSARQLEYLEWFARAFPEFDPYWSRRQAKNTFDVDLKVSRRTKELRQEWYPKGEKRIPDYVWLYLDDLGLACWLMDDGTWVQAGTGKQTKGGIWSICALNFDSYERDRVDEYFDQRGIEGSWICVNKEKDQWIWRTTGNGGVVLQSLVADYIDISEKQGKGYKRWIADPITTFSDETALPAKIKSITHSETVQNKYDITVPPHANYVVSSGLVISNTPAAVNGPHPQKAHADEIELMDSATWRESRSLTIGKRLPDGRWCKPQDIGTSTRKGPNGRMQKLIDEITDAVALGYRPPRKLYQWCIKETAAQVLNCRIACPDLPENEKCQCHRIRKGEWEKKEGEDHPRPRLLMDICKGDLYRSRGWQPYSDVVKQFLENDRGGFEVQHLCLKPEMRFHYLSKFTEDQYCIRNYDPDPDNGPIFTSTDWGGTNPSAVGWYQYLVFDVDVDRWLPVPDQPTKYRLRAGTIVAFDEIYQAEIGNTRLGHLVKIKEAHYRRRWGPKWQVRERFADPQGKAARLDWQRMGLKTKWHITREFEEHIKVSNDLFDDDLFFVDGEKCPMWVREAKEWRRHPVTMQQVDTFNHRMSDYRYAISNIRKLYPQETDTQVAEVPHLQTLPRESRVSISVRKDDEGPLGFAAHSNDEFTRWRQQLGEPVRHPSI